MNTIENLMGATEELYTLLLCLNRKVFSHDDIIKRLSIPPSHAKVIFHLHCGGEASVSEIAKNLSISKSNMTPIIDKLIQENLVERFKDEFVFMQHPGHSSSDMYRRGCTKAHGIEHLIKELGLSDKDTYAFGDGENDIEMFQRVKYGIAMGDAHETLIPHAYKQTENVPNEGIYKALLELGLI